MVINILVLLVLVIIVFLWIAAFVFYNKSGWNGLKHWFTFLIVWVFLEACFWLFILKPVENCSGFLCGLEELLIFLLLTIGSGLFLGLLVYRRSRQHQEKSLPEKNEEVLDESF